MATADDARFLEDFGRRLKLLRTQRGLGQQQMAERVGMHRTFWGQLERGQRGVNIVQLPAIAAAMGVPIEALFSDEVLLSHSPRH